MNKKCFKCKKTKEIKHFYKHGQMADGYLGKCKLCIKKYTKERYYSPEGRKKVIEYERKRFQDPLRKQKLLEYQRKRRNLYKGKERCRRAVISALRDGRLIKGTCEMCGELKVEAHHDDYRSPLKVRWLCRKHHLEVEGKTPF